MTVEVTLCFVKGVKSRDLRTPGGSLREGESRLFRKCSEDSDGARNRSRMFISQSTHETVGYQMLAIIIIIIILLLVCHLEDAVIPK